MEIIEEKELLGYLKSKLSAEILSNKYHFAIICNKVRDCAIEVSEDGKKIEFEKNYVDHKWLTEPKAYIYGKIELTPSGELSSSFYHDTEFDIKKELKHFEFSTNVEHLKEIKEDIRKGKEGSHSLHYYYEQFDKNGISLFVNDIMCQWPNYHTLIPAKQAVHICAPDKLWDRFCRPNGAFDYIKTKSYFMKSPGIVQLTKQYEEEGKKAPITNSLLGTLGSNGLTSLAYDKLEIATFDPKSDKYVLSNYTKSKFTSVDEAIKYYEDVYAQVCNQQLANNSNPESYKQQIRAMLESQNITTFENGKTM